MLLTERPFTLSQISNGKIKKEAGGSYDIGNEGCL